MDKEESIAILNNSSWNVVEPITSHNKAVLIQRLIDEDVIVRRERNMKAFRRGLEALGFLKLPIKHTSLMKHFFVVEHKALTPEEFLGLVTCNPSMNPEKRAHDFFKEFVTYVHGKQLYWTCIMIKM